MKHLKTIASCALVLAAACAQAAGPLQLSVAQARHLLVCTDFAPDQSEVEALTGQSARLPVSGLIRKAQMATPLYPAPAFASQPPPIGNSPQNASYTTDFRQRYTTVARDWKLASHYPKGKQLDAYYKINSCLCPIGGRYGCFCSIIAA